MSFFDGNSGFDIEDFFKRLSGGEGVSEYRTSGSDGIKKTMRKSLNRSRRIPENQVVTSDKVFFIFDFSGEKDVKVNVVGGSENEGSSEDSTPDNFLEINSLGKDLGRYALPKKIDIKNFESTFKNGILEVNFKK